MPRSASWSRKSTIARTGSPSNSGPVRGGGQVVEVGPENEPTVAAGVGAFVAVAREAQQRGLNPGPNAGAPAPSARRSAARARRSSRATRRARRRAPGCARSRERPPDLRVARAAARGPRAPARWRGARETRPEIDARQRRGRCACARSRRTPPARAGRGRRWDRGGGSRRSGGPGSEEEVDERVEVLGRERRDGENQEREARRGLERTELARPGPGLRAGPDDRRREREDCRSGRGWRCRPGRSAAATARLRRARTAGRSNSPVAAKSAARNGTQVRSTRPKVAATRAGRRQPAPEPLRSDRALDREQHAVHRSPQHEVPRRAVPEPAEQHHDARG